MTRTYQGRGTRAAYWGAVLVIGVAVAVSMLPMATAHSGHSGPGPLGTPGSSSNQTSCPDAQLADPATTAFEQAGASPPSAQTQTVVGCTGEIVLKATTAKPLVPGNAYVAFFTVHNLQTGDSLLVDNTEVELSGAASGGAAYLAADVDGADGLRAVTLSPNAEGQLQMTVTFPGGAPAGKVAFDVSSGSQTGDDDGASGAGGTPLPVPGFEAAIVVGGLVAVALLLKRGRPPRALAILVAAAMLAGPAAAQGGVLTPEVNAIPGGFTLSKEGLDVTVSATTSDPVTTFDFGDFTTAEGPEAAHTYNEAGLYFVQMIAYDPSTLSGRVYSKTVSVGPSDQRVNQAPVATAAPSAHWTTYGEEVTINASGSRDADDDRLTYLWYVGRADLRSTDFVFDAKALTDRPELTWTAPDETGDYQVQVYVLDSRRGFSVAAANVRVTETLPAREVTFGPFNGTLATPDGAPSQVKEVAGPSRANHTFDMAYPGEVNATLTFSTPGGQDPVGPVPDVDFEIVGGSQSTSSGSPDWIDTSLGTGEQSINVWLENGVNQSYGIEVRVTYTLNPFL